MGLVGATFAAAVLIGALPAVASAQQPPPPARPLISFGETEPLIVTWKQLRSGVAVEVDNDTTQELVLTFLLTAFRGGKPVARLPAAQVATVIPETQRVAAADTVDVEVRAAASAPSAGTYTGSLVAFNAGGQAFARRSIVLTVSGSAAAKARPEPLADSLTVTVHRRIWDWGHHRTIDSIEVPLKAPAKPRELDLSRSSLLGSIAGGSSVASVRWTGKTVETGAGTAGITLHVTGLRSIGTYEGKIDLLPQDEKAGEVSLKVIYTDTWWPPLIVLLLGVLTGLWISREVGVTVRYLDLRARLGVLARALAAAKETFAKEAAARAWASYDVMPAYEASARDLRAKVEDLRAGYLTKIPDERVKEVRDEIDKTRANIESFATFGRHLDEVEAALITVPPAHVPALPASVAHPRRPNVEQELKGGLLQGKPIESFSELAALDSAAVTAKASVDRWLEVATAIAAAQQRIDELRRKHADKTAELDGAEKTLSELYERLWDRAGIGDLGGTDKWLESVEVVWNALEEIERAAKPPELVSTHRFAETTFDVTPGRGDLAAQIARGMRGRRAKTFVPAPKRRWRRLARLRRDARMWLLLAIAAALAVVTGLQSLYIGKTFGTPMDYLGLFAWGVTAKLVVDLVVGTIDAVGILRVARA